MTGINFFTAELVAKRLGFLRELVPQRGPGGGAGQSAYNASSGVHG